MKIDMTLELVDIKTLCFHKPNMVEITYKKNGQLKRCFFNQNIQADKNTPLFEVYLFGDLTSQEIENESESITQSPLTVIFNNDKSSYFLSAETLNSAMPYFSSVKQELQELKNVFNKFLKEFKEDFNKKEKIYVEGCLFNGL